MDATGLGRRDFVRSVAGLLGAATLGTVLQGETAQAAENDPVPVASGISYSMIGRWDANKLNQILTVDAPAFFGVSVACTPAQHAVTLYRVTYPSVVPEKANKPITATGLIAIPDVPGTSFPLLSYQHGTVYQKTQVPSIPDQSTETALILAQFAGQGYIVIGADYFGMGLSAEPEGYLVKASHQQATFDMLMASRAVLAHMKLSATKLFLGGWSQGGFVTMAFLEKLEASGVPVSGAATASGPLDGLATLSGFLDFPRKIDATWATILFILTGFSYENYYGVPNLARALINEKYYELSRKVYQRQPYQFAELPTSVKELVRPEYLDPRYFASTEYGRIVTTTLQAYRWVIQSPVRNFYGEIDEIVTPGQGRIAMTYQQSMGSGNNKVEAISTGETDHRGTFVTAVPQWKRWFDSVA